jgi:5'-3' exonuclease
MGIRQLNKFLVSNCDDQAIKKVRLDTLRNKKIVIDASIYLYRFMADNRLIEHMFQMISVLLHYQIEPVFIFDGNSPPEKQDVLQERKHKKMAAETRYKELEQQLNIAEKLDQADIIGEMDNLKKQFIYLKAADYVAVKTLLNSSGISWIEAPGEADELCAHMMLSGEAYACMSEDMDMFAYGCCRVLRHLSLVKHTVLMYNLELILKQLQMNIQEFRQVVVLSGTDYNKDNKTCLEQSFKYFQAYKQAMVLWEGYIPTFYEWLNINTNYIGDLASLLNVYSMFCVKFKNINYDVVRKEKDRAQMVQFLGQDGFVFV